MKANIEGENVYGFWIQRKAGAGQHPQPRRGPIHRCLHRRTPLQGEVYNIGGGQGQLLFDSGGVLPPWSPEEFSGKPQTYLYSDTNRIGDHICYYSDLRKMRTHYPNWDISVSLRETVRQIVAATRAKQSVG